MELWGKGLLALTPMVAVFLAIEAVPVSEFANLGGLTEAYEEPIIIPHLEGVQCVVQWGQPQALPWLSRHPIEQGGQHTRHFFYQPAAVSGNAPLASTAGSS